MKRYYCIYIMIPLFITASDQQSPHTVINNIHHINVSSQAIQNALQTISTPLNNAFDHGKAYYNTLLGYCDQAYGAIIEHPYYTILGSIGCVYCGLNGYAWILSRQLHDERWWSKWKYHLSNEELAQVPIHTLGNNLINEIEQRYINVHNPTDFQQPLIQFYKDIRHEYALLCWYKYICKTIEWTFLARISWYDQRLYELVDMRLQRLEMIWSTFTQWMASYNIGQPT